MPNIPKKDAISDIFLYFSGICNFRRQFEAGVDHRSKILTVYIPNVVHFEEFTRQVRCTVDLAIGYPTAHPLNYSFFSYHE